MQGIKIGWESDMTKKLPFAVILSIFLASGMTTTRAADPGFCKQYAQAALNQVCGGLAIPSCGSGLQGARWSSDFAVHYQWCLGASFGAAGTERDARTRQLRACSGR
jgi:hypothetical protein